MLKALSNLFDSNQKVVKQYRLKVMAINALEEEIKALSDEALRAKTEEFKGRLKQDETLDDILPEAFAVMREAGRRVLGLRHYDVQLIAGMAFHDGKVAEQKTGEGKTLSATSALYLNALAGKGSHLVTVNDYLAERDAGWMARVYDFLGLKTGVIYSGKGDQPAAVYDPDYQGADRGDDRLEHLRPVSRKEAYAADITYGTNNEFGFDYLRDNMVQSLDQMVQRDHFFAIVDEVDSILIDEARTPLIISAPDTDATDAYYDFAKLVDSLAERTDFILDEKLRTVTLTEYGLRRLEKRLNVNNLYEEDYDSIHHVETALKAKTLFHRDTQYVVKDGQVIIVDENTGRLMFGRRYSDGLHQAIEAKEGVKIQQESRTLATISLQNYFRMYQKLAGMTGTAATEAEEFNHIYGMDVVVVPTNRNVARKDSPDMVFKTQRAKYGAIVKEVRELHELGQPVLIGTKSIDQNQIMDRYLKKMKLPHQVLNAKNHEHEAKILAEAGLPRAITVTTNIAGRGVDIVLGGSEPEKPRQPKPDAEPAMHKAYKQELKVYETAIAEWKKRHDAVLKSGGLHVLGTDRHDSRRIDNQLRGRSGRQGDPGSSRFYVSLEDDLMRIFGGEQVAKLMTMLKIPEDQPIESGMVSKSIEQSQVKVEGFHFDQRKRVVEYDDVMNKQREIIYRRRRALLEEMAQSGDSETAAKAKERILELLDEEVDSIVHMRMAEGLSAEERVAIVQEFMTIIPFDKNSQSQLEQQLTNLSDADDVIEKLQGLVHQTYEQREQAVGADTMRQVERFVMLSGIDRQWMDHLDSMDSLREGIWMRGGKEQVLSEYKKEAFAMFEQLLNKVDADVVRRIFRIQIGSTAQPTMPKQTVSRKQAAVELEPSDVPTVQAQLPTGGKGSVNALAAAMAKTAHQAPKQDGRTITAVQVNADEPKIGRNDPCPCGSGKKYKKCGLINAPEHKA